VPKISLFYYDTLDNGRTFLVLVGVTVQIASNDTDGILETMEEIMQLERVTVATGALAIESIENVRVSDIARRIQRCWISTIGYRITPVSVAPQDQRVWNNVRSYRITVHGGSRGPTPNK
jgi:hypothetical protein